MTAVITAIVAALLAAIIAAFREHRNELTKLLVAARVIDAQMRSAGAAANALLAYEPLVIGRFGSLAGVDDYFMASWNEHRGVLARHLTEYQWAIVQFGIQMAVTTGNTLEPADDEAGKRQLVVTVSGAFDRASAVLQTYSLNPGRLRNPGKKIATSELAAYRRRGEGDPADDATPR